MFLYTQWGFHLLPKRNAQTAFLGLWTDKSAKSLKSLPGIRHASVRRRYRGILLTLSTKSLAEMSRLVLPRHQTLQLRILVTMPSAFWTSSVPAGVTVAGRTLVWSVSMVLDQANQETTLSIEQTVKLVRPQSLSLLPQTPARASVSS
jgi:hypothetical protein